MPDSLARMLLEQTRDAPVRIVYGVATGDNTVAVRGASTAVTLPAITSVVSGQYCAVLEAGADRLILGPVDSAWVSFTPSWTNLTVGNGTQAGQYIYVPGGMRVRAMLTLGSTSSISGNVSFTIPNSETTANDGCNSVGALYLLDASTFKNYSGSARAGAAVTSISLYAGDDNVAAANPFTFTTSDEISVDMLITL